MTPTERRWAKDQVTGGRAGWLGGVVTPGYLKAVRLELLDWLAQIDRELPVEDGDPDGRSG